ncbi:hypothetical protein P5673_018010 [Acropora cervicornis]|uniref:Uncharacterized protein n=1 Tax=Acropora cervicornis TaxID=6130 RepID=A0AAD9QDX6_ACRCE|nr:hypothetical protein P5673_018010 [Acropora cervicornis]
MSDANDPNATPGKEKGPDFQENMKEMLASALADVREDILNSVHEAIDFKFNEWAEGMDNNEANYDDTPFDSGLDVNSLMQNVITPYSTLYKEQSDLQATPEETASKSGQSTEKSCLEDLVAEFNPEKATGPPISEKLAELTNGLLKEGLSKDQISTINQKYLKPKNCPFLEAPKVNNLLWNQLKQEPKNLDTSLQKGQGFLMSALYAMITVCNDLAQNHNDVKNPYYFDSRFGVGPFCKQTARRDLLRPHLNKPYQSLCNPSTPITSYLFGEDLNKQVDDLTKANKIGHKVQGPSTKPRYHPYGSSSGARGRGYRQNYLGRGRGSNYTPGARKGPFLGSGRGGPPQRLTR